MSAKREERVEDKRDNEAVMKMEKRRLENVLQEDSQISNESGEVEDQSRPGQSVYEFLHQRVETERRNTHNLINLIFDQLELVIHRIPLGQSSANVTREITEDMFNYLSSTIDNISLSKIEK